jgi:Na+-transporting NADH:ubiquinone oxidoreductase subunit A
VEAEHAELLSYTGKAIPELSAEEVEALLLESGLWTTLRTRPFGKVPTPGSRPHSIFVTAMETSPLGADVDAVLEGSEGDFNAGVQCLAKLSGGATYVCQKPGSKVAAACPQEAQVEEFAGPHPAGTVGVHVHLINPVSRNKTIWHVSYQDVIAAGRLFQTGRLDVTRVVALGGPPVNKPRLLKTRVGACVDELVQDELADGENRVISGSVISGRKAMGEVHGYLGPFHLQISALCENRKREFLGWMAPGMNKFSVLPVFLSCLIPKRLFNLTTSLHGSRRPIVPFGVYERVFPFDMPATYLLRALSVDDIEEAERLGCLELDEEDLALCTFVCPGKSNYGTILRRNLDLIEKEG